jgi:hypothetical protein
MTGRKRIGVGYHLVTIPAAFAALISLGSPVVAQGTGVDCVASKIGMERLQVLGALWVGEEIGPDELGEELRPAIRAYIDGNVIVEQSQVDASFSYTVAVLEALNYGTVLQGAGIDPSAVEDLWTRMPAHLQDAMLAYAGGADALPEDELETFVAANSDADENGKLGTAVVFLLSVAASIEAGQRFAGAASD